MPVGEDIAGRYWEDRTAPGKRRGRRQAEDGEAEASQVLDWDIPTRDEHLVEEDRPWLGAEGEDMGQSDPVLYSRASSGVQKGRMEWMSREDERAGQTEKGDLEGDELQAVGECVQQRAVVVGRQVLADRLAGPKAWEEDNHSDPADGRQTWFRRGIEKRRAQNEKPPKRDQSPGWKVEVAQITGVPIQRAVTAQNRKSPTTTPIDLLAKLRANGAACGKPARVVISLTCIVKPVVMQLSSASGWAS